MVTIRVSETYDLRTAVNKLGLLGIHTPSTQMIARLYPGLLLNYKYMHIDKCDFGIACASTLPADPLQVGTESGDIAPQDLFNPILYRAVSNDAFETIVNRIYGSDLNPINAGQDGSVTAAATIGNSPFTGYQNTTSIYYSLLSEDGWRKAMPQSGFAMNNLVPLVYSMVNTFGNTMIPASSSSLNTATQVGADGSVSNNSGMASTFRGPTMPMPRLPTITQSIIQPTWVGSSSQPSTIPLPSFSKIPKTFVALICVPPAKQHILFYRLRVVWTITLSEPVTLPARSDLGSISNVGAYQYSDWTTTSGSKTLEDAGASENGTIDGVDVDIEQIMQS